jgi:hypothetical protein
MAEQLGQQVVVLSQSPEEFLRFWKSANERFERVVRDARMEAEQPLWRICRRPK